MHRAARLALAALAPALLLGAGASGPLRVEAPDGGAVALAPAAGERALVAHFWASWCPECVRELPLLARLAPRCAQSGVRVVAVNVGESAEAVERYREAHGLALALLRDPKGAVFRRLGARGLPANAVWRVPGEDPRVEVGPRDEAAWLRALRELGCDAEAAP